MRRAPALLLTVSLLAGACGDDGAASESDAETTTSAATTSQPTTTTADVSTSPDPEPETFGVGVREVTFTDTTRATPPSGDQPGADERMLESVVFYPTLGDPTAGAERDAAPAVDGGPFPLIVFSHGLGGSPEGNQAVLAGWVAAGAVVVAPRFPLSRPDNPAGPDAGDVQNQSGDVSFLIDAMIAESNDAGSPFAGLIDAALIGAAGHSQGAITTIGVTLHSCCADARIGAAIEMAGTTSPFAGGEYDFELAPPYMIVHGTEDALVTYSAGVALYNELAGPKGMLTLEGGGHSDMFDPGSIWFDGVVAATTDFWHAYLGGDDSARERLSTPAHGDLRWFGGGSGPPDVIPTTTIAGIDRQVTVEPTTGLVDGDVVTVTWNGFTPGGTVNVVQCSGGGTSGAGFCDLTTGHILQPNPSGSGTIELEIVTGPVGEGTCGSGSTDCVVTVNDSGDTTDPAATIRVPLEFAG